MQTSLEPAELRSAFSRFATGVTVVTYLFDRRPHGITVNSFTSVSLQPPLILVSIAHTAAAASRLTEGDFAINVLSEDQEDHALQFCGRQQDELEVKWNFPDRGAPELVGAVAVYQCTRRMVLPAGDHDLHIADVKSVSSSTTSRPLCFVNGKFTRLPTHSPQA